MNTTIHLKKSFYEKVSNTPLYSFIVESNNESNFMLGGHATLHYYMPKISKIEDIDESKKIAPLPIPKEKTLCITTSKNSTLAYINNLFSNKNNTVLYLSEKEAAYDIERTWKIIQEKRNLKGITTLSLHMEHWSKIVYAYRAATSYGVTVEDITY